MGRKLQKLLLVMFAGLTLLTPSSHGGERTQTLTIDTGQFALLDASDGRRQTLRTLIGTRATVIFFAGIECPVSVAYEQDLARLASMFNSQDVALVAVNANYADTVDKIKAHRASAKLPYAVYQDVDGRLTETLGATRSSEVVLLDPRGQVVYQGRIDDRVTTAVRRASATRHELRDAISATLAGKPVAIARTEASGCFISRPQAASAAADVTYAKDVAPIIQRYCVMCHSPGQAGPMSLQTYEQVAAWSRTIVEVLRQNRMPPTRLAPPDPRYGDFVKTPEPTAAEIDTITQWTEAGTPQGTTTKATVAAIPDKSDEWLIGKPDLILTMPQAYMVPATGVVPYQYYEILTYTGEERWVEAVEIKPGVRSVVHHANVYMAQAELLTVGFDFGERWAAFAPGRPPITFPDGVARRLPKNAKLTLEVHYTPDGVAREDRTRIGIRFARNAPRYEARSIPLGTLNFRIPPHAPNHEVTATYTLKGDGRIASFTPHMHDRGKDFRYEAILPGGTTRTLLFVPKYNFKWQFVYVPTEMIALPKGTVLRATAHYDNSAANPTNPDPSATVTFGLQTFEEMMFGFVDLVYDDEVNSPNLRALRAADRESLPRDWGFDSWQALLAWRREFLGE